VVVMNDDPGLVEERTHSYLAGAEYRHGPYMCEVNGFLNDVRNLFLSVDTDDPATLGVVEYTRVNFGDAKIWGGELNLGYAWGWNTWQLGYVEQRALRNDSDPTYGSNEYFRTPTRYGIFTWDLDSPWAQLFAAVRYTGPMAVPHAAGYIAADRLERSPDFWELDLSLSKAFDLSDWLGAGLTLTAGGKNVANAYQGDLDQGPNRDAAYVYGPRFPRSWFASAKLEF
jgi:outer membrane receptor for ferrienterochelin and colicins